MLNSIKVFKKIMPNWKVLFLLLLCSQPLKGSADAIGVEIITLTSHVSDYTITTARLPIAQAMPTSIVYGQWLLAIMIP